VINAAASALLGASFRLAKPRGAVRRLTDFAISTSERDDRSSLSSPPRRAPSERTCVTPAAEYGLYYLTLENRRRTTE